MWNEEENEREKYVFYSANVWSWSISAMWRREEMKTLKIYSMAMRKRRERRKISIRRERSPSMKCENSKDIQRKHYWRRRRKKKRKYISLKRRRKHMTRRRIWLRKERKRQSSLAIEKRERATYCLSIWEIKPPYLCEEGLSSTTFLKKCGNDSVAFSLNVKYRENETFSWYMIYSRRENTYEMKAEISMQKCVEEASIEAIILWNVILLKPIQMKLYFSKCSINEAIDDRKLYCLFLVLKIFNREA